MNTIYWKQNEQLCAGTTLRNPLKKENNNMALHVGGNLEDVISNRKDLCRATDTELTQWCFSCQTHSDHFHSVTKSDAGRGTRIYEDGIPNCDALYTHEKDLAIGVFHADCVAILLYDPYSKIIGAIHSGWQGTVKEITRKTLEHLIQHEHVQREHLHAYIAPAIAYRSFEVGMDVVEQVRSMSFDTSSFITLRQNDKALIDNKGLNRQMLLNAGVSAHHIQIDKNDTFMKNDALFSYRRDPQCGRHMSFIMMKDRHEDESGAQI